MAEPPRCQAGSAPPERGVALYRPGPVIAGIRFSPGLAGIEPGSAALNNARFCRIWQGEQRPVSGGSGFPGRELFYYAAGGVGFVGEQHSRQLVVDLAQDRGAFAVG